MFFFCVDLNYDGKKLSQWRQKYPPSSSYLSITHGNSQAHDSIFYIKSLSQPDPVPVGNVSVDGLRCSMLVKLAADASDIWYILHACIHTRSVRLYLLSTCCVYVTPMTHTLGLAMQHGIRILIWCVWSTEHMNTRQGVYILVLSNHHTCMIVKI